MGVGENEAPFRGGVDEGEARARGRDLRAYLPRERVVGERDRREDLHDRCERQALPPFAQRDRALEGGGVDGGVLLLLLRRAAWMVAECLLLLTVSA
eukprot:COSAG01_NODE_15268_length_1355_cov_31.581843_1_plen_96_part_10